MSTKKQLAAGSQELLYDVGLHNRAKEKLGDPQAPGTEMWYMNISWGEAQHGAMDRMRWKTLTEALCPTDDEEE